jgi:peptidoglycan/LPS O-acetylase OafA/YrhL
MLFSLMFARPLFGLCVAYIAFRAVTGRARAINWFLSRQGWVPIARLSYAIYLVQFVSITPIYARWSQPFNTASTLGGVLTLIASETAAVVTLTFALALICYLAVEKPFMNLRDRER